MVLSELTNKELKGILRENNVRNYSKLNKKNLVKKVNQLIKAQNGGGKKSGKGENKKYTLKELIGGTGVLGPNGKPVANGSQPAANGSQPAAATRANGAQPAAATKANGAQPNGQPLSEAETVANPNISSPAPAILAGSNSATAPLLNKNEERRLANNEEARQLSKAKNLSLQNINNKPKDECGACSIL